MNFATVCSGIGAPEVAWPDWNPIFCSEIETFPCAVLKHHYPNVPNLGDMTKYKEWPDYDLTDGVICAGTPCQAFSIAGLRKGLDDPRGNLTLVFLGIIRRYRPRWMAWENVPGIFSSITTNHPNEMDAPNDLQEGEERSYNEDYEVDSTHALSCFLAGLKELGYGVAVRVLDAQYTGVPQRRRRVFVVGHLGDWRRAAAVLFERHSLQGHNPPSRKAGKDFAADLAPSLTSSGRGVERTGESRGQDPVIAHTTGAGFWKEGFGTLRAREQDSHENIIALHGTQDPCISDVAFAQGRNSGQENVICGTLDSGSGKRRGAGIPPETLVMAHGQGNAEIVRDGSPSLTCNHEAPIAFKPGQSSDSRSIGAQEDVACTLEAGGGGNNKQAIAIQAGNTKQNGCGFSEGPAYTVDCAQPQSVMSGPYMQVRRLTPRECERLQGFPDDYTLIQFRNKPAADGPRYKALGNSMAVPVVRWVGKRIEMVENIN